jgi:cytoskeletal protein CcmA (bactofilin family)
MFKKSVREQKAPRPEGSPSPSLQATVPAAGSPESQTVIGENISIEGIIQANENLIIEGAVKGSIIARSHKLTIGKKGRVEASIFAQNIVIGGKMTGNAAAFDKLHITQTADFTGQIKAKSVSVEDGCIMNAAIEIDKGTTEKSPTLPQRIVEALVFPAEPQCEKIAKTEISATDSHN